MEKTQMFLENAVEDLTKEKTSKFGQQRKY